MKWEFVESEGGRRRISVEAAWEEIASDYGDIVDEYVNVPVSGFRRGKVPRAIVERRFQREIIDELFQRCTQRLGREVIRLAGEETIGSVEATDIGFEKSKPFRFQVSYYPLPEFTVPDYSLLKPEDDGADPRDHLSRTLLELVNFDVTAESVRAELAFDSLEDSDPASSEWLAASDRVRLMLILKRIARQEGIEVDESDVEQRIREKAVDFGTKPERLKGEFEQGGCIQRLRDMLLAERVLECLMEHITVQPQQEASY